MRILAGLLVGLVAGGVGLGQGVGSGGSATSGVAFAGAAATRAAVSQETGRRAGVSQNAAQDADESAGRRPMMFADLQRMKRLSDPQISTSGTWVMFSAMDVDLAANTKISHLWVVPLAGGRERQLTFWKEGEANGRFSPDGKRLMFVSADGGMSSQIYLADWNEVEGKMGTPKQLTHVSTEADGAVWSPDSKRILFVSRVYPECSDEESWHEEDNCNRRRDDAAAKSQVKAMVFDHLLYRHWNSYVGAKRSHVLVVSATDGNLVRDLTPRKDIGDAEAPVFSLGGPVGYAWAPDSKEIAYVTNLDAVRAASTNNDVITLRLDEQRARPVRISTSSGSDNAPAYSPDGRWLAFRSQARAGYESDQFRLMVFDRSKSASQQVSESAGQQVGKSAGQKNSRAAASRAAEEGPLRELLPRFDLWVEEFRWAPDSKTIYFVSGELGDANVLSVGVDLPEATAIANRAEYGDLQISRDGRTIVTSMMTVRSPAAISAIPLDTEGHGGAPVARLTHMNDALLTQLDLPRMESFMFPGAENTTVQGFLLRPPGFDATKKYPVKFLIHGGPEGAWGNAWSYRWNPELMAASGYVVVMVNPRGSTGYGQAFIDGVNGDWGGKAYIDLMKGLDYAEQHYGFIDKTRECALGASYGGYMANWILTHTNRFACIVTHDGMFNPQSAYGTTEELWFNEWEFRAPGDKEPGQPWRYFDRPVATDPFRKWSPMLSIRNAKTPTLVIHGQRDYRLDVSEGFQLFTALQRLNVPSRMLYFPDEGHWVLKPQNSQRWYEEVGEWCDRWTRSNTYSGTVQ
ncbi:S9 family peptidase [Edaphobacter aggregans]|uniref:S9 family peptidase n=1 Tax=Edaphobacter aggregans TaxID=570835 RepID=UPI001FE1F1C1|nr:S9 family peptidase [Edaphobacter aggregans]